MLGRERGLLDARGRDRGPGGGGAEPGTDIRRYRAGDGRRDRVAGPRRADLGRRARQTGGRSPERTAADRAGQRTRTGEAPSRLSARRRPSRRRPSRRCWSPTPIRQPPIPQPPIPPMLVPQAPIPQPPIPQTPIPPMLVPQPPIPPMLVPSTSCPSRFRRTTTITPCSGRRHTTLFAEAGAYWLPGSNLTSESPVLVAPTRYGRT